jgi:deoxyribose-phosphate aldolase
MCQAIKAWYEQTGEKIGYKPAGGIVTTEDAVKHYTIVKEILGEEWLNNKFFRLGASRLANNLLTSILGKETKYF